MMKCVFSCGVKRKKNLKFKTEDIFTIVFHRIADMNTLVEYQRKNNRTNQMIYVGNKLGIKLGN